MLAFSKAPSSSWSPQTTAVGEAGGEHCPLGSPNICSHRSHMQSHDNTPINAYCVPSLRSGKSTRPAGGQTCRAQGASDPGCWPQPLPALSQGQRQHHISFFLSHGDRTSAWTQSCSCRQKAALKPPFRDPSVRVGFWPPVPPGEPFLCRSVKQQAFLQRVLVEPNLLRKGVP